MIFNSD